MIGGVVTGAAGSRKGGDAALNEASGRDIIVDAGHVRNVNRLGIENSLSARNRGPW
jgi:hypothetical protein